MHVMVTIGINKRVHAKFSMIELVTFEKIGDQEAGATNEEKAKESPNESNDYI